MKNFFPRLVVAGLFAASVLQTNDVFAFAITPVQPGATVLYDASESVICGPAGGFRCTTTLSPLSVTNLARGGTAGFLARLGAEFPLWVAVAAGADLAGTFNITHYDAVNNGARAGANFIMDYVAGAGDPAGDLHWIQRVFDNHKLGAAHGTAEDVIDFLAAGVGQTRPAVPYYDVLPTGPGAIAPFAVPPHFEDGPGREALMPHTWTAEVYLVRQTAARNVTIYNGVRWGWVNTIRPIPEPGTLLLIVAGFGFIGWCSRGRFDQVRQA